MPIIEPSIKLVRTLKGAPLSVLVIMRLVGQPVTAEYLERTSGYSDKPINAALQLLEDYGMITRNGRYAWQIAAGAQQLPLGADLLPEITTPDSQGDDAALEPASQDDSEESEETDTGTRNNSESEKFRVPSSSSRSLNLDLDQFGKPPLLERDPEKIRVAENLAACEAAGIQEPTRSRISRLTHVTSKLIRYHAETAPNIALAIYRIKNGWRIKPGWNDAIPESGITGICDVCARTSPAEPEAEIPVEAVEAWNSALAAIEKQIKRADYETWVKPMQLVGYDPEDGYRVRSANSIGAKWFEDHAIGELRKILGANIRMEER